MAVAGRVYTGSARNRPVHKLTSRHWSMCMGTILCTYINYVLQRLKLLWLRRVFRECHQCATFLPRDSMRKHSA